MQVTSTCRYARISAFKAREVTREIQGQSASAALDLLAFSPKKAALLVQKTLKSAIANAENNSDLRVNTLLVKEAVVGEGPTFKRFRARARGGASPLRKRTSHIRIVLSDELVPEPPAKRARRSQAARDGAAGKKSKTKTQQAATEAVAKIAPAVEPDETKIEAPTASSEQATKPEPAEEKE
jgi:large subunit ribosomal protein L22